MGSLGSLRLGGPEVGSLGPLILGGPEVGGLGGVSLTATDCSTGRRTILLWTNNMGGWSVARSDGPSLLVKQAPGVSQGRGP